MIYPPQQANQKIIRVPTIDRDSQGFSENEDLQIKIYHRTVRALDEQLAVGACGQKPSSCSLETLLIGLVESAKPGRERESVVRWRSARLSFGD